MSPTWVLRESSTRTLTLHYATPPAGRVTNRALSLTVTLIPHANTLTRSTAETAAAAQTGTLHGTRARATAETAHAADTTTAVLAAANLVANGTFETNAAGWTCTGQVGVNILARVVGTAHGGTGYGALTVGVTGAANLDCDKFPVTEGHDLTASAWARWTTGTPKPTRLDFRWFNAGGTAVGTTRTGTAATPTTGAWTQLSETFTVPTGISATQALVRLVVPTAAAGDVLAYDDVTAVLDGGTGPDDLTGYTQLTTPGANPRATIQAALDADGHKVALMAGEWLCDGSLLFDSGMELYVAAGVNLWKDFTNTGATSAGFLRNRNFGTRISNVKLWGAGNIAATTGSAGNIVSMAVDDLTSQDWTTSYWTGGRHTMIAGDRIHFSNHQWTSDPDSGSGTGGLRFAGGDAFLGENLNITSGDDTFQFVPAGAVADPLFNIADTTNGVYRNCTGRSLSARLMVVALQDSENDGDNSLGMTPAVADCAFSNVTGFGGGSAVVVKNASSTGTTRRVTFTACTVDQSMTLTPTTGQPAEVYVLRGNASGVAAANLGLIDSIDFGGLTILNPRAAKALYRADGTLITNITQPHAG